jgi:hypothetical protein
MPQVPGPVSLAPSQGTAQAAGEPAPARRAQRKARAPVTVSIPLVAILGVAVYVAYKYMGCASGRRSCACSPDSSWPLPLPPLISARRSAPSCNGSAALMADRLQAPPWGHSPARPTQGVMPVARPLP